MPIFWFKRSHKQKKCDRIICFKRSRFLVDAIAFFPLIAFVCGNSYLWLGVRLS
ncbi:hypothetical protein [Moorena sp. SIO3I6]|uniref:hypothetical protein n=1 Tax=Moorena sp. SIO3I6 TaxID=2607831 RepID=UPI0013FAE0FB|nr:hypothetical protein [Moorena sp. SIO3I6]NEP24364.1 hypothetical protein [Moorena sp. SIO3I6]